MLFISFVSWCVSAKLRIGDGAHFVGLVLDKACEQCAENRRLVERIYTDSLPKQQDSPGGAKKKKLGDMEERWV